MKIKRSGASTLLKLSKSESQIQWEQLENCDDIIKSQQLEVLAKENLELPSFKTFSSLTHLTLSGTTLSGLDQISSLILQKLKISGSNIDSIPNINVEQLINLALPRNKITLAQILTDKKSPLQDLDLGQNQITKLDIDFALFPDLKRINLEHNKLTELPEELFELKNLSHLALKGNPLNEMTQQKLYDVFKIVFE